ncbi:hypothetical protein BV97_03970 [Novosphingobium resinovorum]|uniref:Uncharacterized protein n=1 Tax=Novosphingobium resinovorum TaxID=158500 RepID=A0A031JRW0_9SPHN|nr:hypothetical protein [Novosphingobium resinovorum]EZP79533.1 hypothetical protein BV97_03970 [Novosphingobium resinovorum]
MRFAGVGLLIAGGLVGVGSLGTETAASALIALTAGGFMFVAGAVFAAGAGIQDAIKRRS